MVNYNWKEKGPNNAYSTAITLNVSTFWTLLTAEKFDFRSQFQHFVIVTKAIPRRSNTNEIAVHKCHLNASDLMV